MFEGNSIRLHPLADGLVELVFDRRGEAINKFDARTVAELREAVALLAADAGLQGVLVTSPKDVFIVGADITEFGATFQQSAEAITAGVRRSNEVFVALEDLPVPTVVAINGYALGGGLELALAATLRVMSTAAQVGVPEVKLGLFPGFGGTVRLARVAGLETAMRWVATGTPADARTALAASVVDAVAEPEALRDEALALLRRCVAGDVDWRAQVARKHAALPGDATAFAATVQQVLADLAPRLGRHQPAAPMALAMMAEGASQPRDEAMRLEAEAFGRVARTQAAASLVRTFLNEQAVRKAAKKQAAGARAPARAAVLGAGIMGGGIAFSSALAGIPVRMKDIRADQLDLGMTEAARQLGRRVQAGRLSQAKADAVLAAITPQLDDAGLDAADLVVEAIVERLEVKQQVLAALEPQLRPDALIATNTSSLRLADIAKPLARPQNLVGMHFFNP
ncbi:MAG: 3-hydroxyacyl-CoA dehydrogenase NAD-binding domain-containing protein, partial [Gammaproteobacteria bacterium]